MHQFIILQNIKLQNQQIKNKSEMTPLEIPNTSVNVYKVKNKCVSRGGGGIKFV